MSINTNLNININTKDEVLNLNRFLVCIKHILNNNQNNDIIIDLKEPIVSTFNNEDTNRIKHDITNLFNVDLSDDDLIHCITFVDLYVAIKKRLNNAPI